MPQNFSRNQFVAHRVNLDIQADTPKLGKCLDALFGGYFPLVPIASSPPAGAFLIVAQTVASAKELPAIGPEFTQTWQCTPEGGLEITGLADQTRRILLLEGRAMMLYDLAAREATITAVDSAWGAVGFHCLVPFLAELLADDGHFLLHAAANRIPGTDDAVLLFGHSGAGKTTTSLALGYGGMDVVCDDACFFSANDGEFTLWPLPRESHVHIETIDLLPQMKFLPKRSSRVEGEFSIDHCHLPGCDPRKTRNAAAVILLEPRNPGDHLIQPLTAIEALPELLTRVLRVVEPIASGPAGKMFQTLSQLCSQRPCLSLSVGPDLHSLTPMLLDALA